MPVVRRRQSSPTGSEKTSGPRSTATESRYQVDVRAGIGSVMRMVSARFHSRSILTKLPGVTPATAVPFSVTVAPSAHEGMRSCSGNFSRFTFGVTVSVMTPLKG